MPEAMIVEEEKELSESVESGDSVETDMIIELLSEPLNFETFGEAFIAEGYGFTVLFRLASVVGTLLGQVYHIGDVAINGHYLLILNDHEEVEKLLEIFNRFKDEGE